MKAAGKFANRISKSNKHQLKKSGQTHWFSMALIHKHRQFKIQILKSVYPYNIQSLSTLKEGDEASFYLIKIKNTE